MEASSEKADVPVFGETTENDGVMRNDESNHQEISDGTGFQLEVDASSKTQDALLENVSRAENRVKESAMAGSSHSLRYPCCVVGCEYTTGLVEAFRSHHQTEHSRNGRQSLVCKLCDCSLMDIEVAVSHLEKDHFHMIRRLVGGETKSAGQSWLYPCMIEGCGVAFECLADLRLHFVNCHQPEAGGPCIPCCFCTREFPTWDDSVSNHIGSHVRVGAIWCVECRQKFDGKEALMEHLLATHAGLAKGISIDVSIRNHERRRFKISANGQVKSSAHLSRHKGIESSAVALAARANEDSSTDGTFRIPAILDKQVLDKQVTKSSTEDTLPISEECGGDAVQQIQQNGTTEDSPAVDGETMDVMPVTEISEPTNEDEISSVSATVAPGSSTEVEVAVSGSDMTEGSSAQKEPEEVSFVTPSSATQAANGSSSSKANRRKSRKPVRVANDEPEDEVVDERSEPSVVESPAKEQWVELVKASHPMLVRCLHCSYTCNAEFHLKVHTYECHEKPKVAGAGQSSWFTCRLCSNASETLAIHRRHLAHHCETTIQPVRVFACVYCERQSDHMDVLESHVGQEHPHDELKFEVSQSPVSYLQDMFSCPVCSGAFSWREDLLRHFGAVHRLEGLVAHLELEFPNEVCPPMCRVPRSLFKDLLIQSSSPALSLSGGNSAQSVADARSITKQREMAKFTGEDGMEVGGFGAEDDAEIHQELEHGKEKTCQSVGALGGRIQRFHCDRCDYSANDPTELSRHAAFHDDLPATSRSSADDSLELRLSSMKFKQFKKQKKLRYRCELCPFASSKAPNLRRHAVIHARAAEMRDGYRCSYCHFAHEKRNCVQFHLTRYHSDKPARFAQLANGIVVDTVDNDTAHIVAKALAARSKMVIGEMVTVPSPVDPLPVPRKERPPQETKLRPSVLTEDMGDSSTAAIEQLLPQAMIYSSPVQCPMCSFSNRVRINLVRHIRLYHSTGGGGALAKSGLQSPVAILNKDSALPLGEPATTPVSRQGLSTSPGVGVFVPSVDDTFLRADADRMLLGNLAGFHSRPGKSPVPTPLGVDAGKYLTKTAPTSFYRCILCGFQALRQIRAKQHVLRVHRGQVPYECRQCAVSVIGWRDLMRHANEFHPTDVGSVAAQAYEKYTPYLKQHIRKIGGFGVARQQMIAVKQSPEVDDGLNADSSEIVRDVPSENLNIYNQSAGSVSSKTVLNVPTYQSSNKLSLLDGNSGPEDERDHGQKVDPQRESRPTREQRRSTRYVCRYCSHSESNMDALEQHIWMSHPDKPLVFDLVSDSAEQSRSDVATPAFERLLPSARPSGEPCFSPPANTSAGFIPTPVKAEVLDSAEPVATELPKELDMTPGRRDTTLTVYQCQTCGYCSETATVMRQHIMAQHLQYKPYACPYCDESPRAVKSFPITKHVRMHHPLTANARCTFIYIRDNDMEDRVRDSYRLVSRNEAMNVLNEMRKSSEMSGAKEPSMELQPEVPPSDVLSPPQTKKAKKRPSDGMDVLASPKIPKPGSISSGLGGDSTEVQSESSVDTPLKKVAAGPTIYRCCYCTLTTKSRADIRQHLMREISYKPYKCGHCVSGYSEPTKAAMTKHFKVRHAGMVVDIIEKRNAAKDTEVEELLARCANGPGPELGSEVPKRTSRFTPLSHAARMLEQGGTKPSDPLPEAPVTEPEESCTDLDLSADTNSGADPVPKKKKKRVIAGSYSLSRYYKCHHCKYRSRSDKRLREHVVDKHSSERLRCSHCDFVEYDEGRLKRHWQKSHADLPFEFVKVTEIDDADQESNLSSSFATSSVSDANASIKIDPDEPIDQTPAHKLTTRISKAVLKSNLEGDSQCDNVPSAMDEEVRYCCDYCPVSFSRPDELASHTATAHADSVTAAQDDPSLENDDVQFESEGSDAEDGILSEGSDDAERPHGPLKARFTLQPIVQLVDISVGLSAVSKMVPDSPPQIAE